LLKYLPSSWFWNMEIGFTFLWRVNT
jgi:hypothetical protein